MLISLSTADGVESHSATKAVIASSKLVFGTKGEAIVKRMEELVKIKELDTSKIDYVLDQIKTSTDADLQKWKATASGKATITSVRALVSAKSLVQVINALRSIKVPRAATQTGLKGTSAPVAKTKTPVKGGLSIHTFQQMYELFQRDDNDEYKCAKRIAKMAGVAKIPKSAIGGWTGNEDNEELYFFAPQANGPVDAVIISETSSMARSLKDMKGKGGVTVAVVHVRDHIENLLYGNARTRKATQLGKFANFDEAMAAFLGAIPTVLTAKRPAAKTSTKAKPSKSISQAVPSYANLYDALMVGGDGNNELALYKAMGLRAPSSTIEATIANFGGDEDCIFVINDKYRMGVVVGKTSLMVDEIKQARGKGAYTVATFTNGDDLPSDLPKSAFKQQGVFKTWDAAYAAFFNIVENM